MVVRKPTVGRVVVLDGTVEDDGVTVPYGVAHVSLSPRGTTTINVAFQKGDSQRTGNFVQLVNGQALNLDVAGDDVFDTFGVFMFAAAATTVDVLWW